VTDALDITSPSNARLKALVALHKRRSRAEAGVTVVEGYDELTLAVEAGVVPTTLYWCPELVADGRTALVEQVAGAGAETVSLGRTAYEKVSYRDSPDGFLAVVPDPTRSLDTLDLPDKALVLVVEGIEKPGNLGAMLRTAEAAGVDAVVAASPVTDWANPNVVRASKGTLFVVPVANAATEKVIAWLRDSGIAIVVATPEADRLVTEVDLTGLTALVVGTEHEGVSDAFKAAADHLVKLPMAGRINSLNVATAAAVTVYEAVRQRHVDPSESWLS
jgi:TrmH family RNA methyltransferase